VIQNGANQASSQPQDDESNGYMTGNVDNSDGARKEIPQINDMGHQARSKYFPSHNPNSNSSQNQAAIPRIKLQ